jgi:hypothetical protein
MKTPATLGILLLMALLTLPAAADTLSVRLVQMSNGAAYIDPDLSDMAGTIKQLPYSTYKIVDSKTVALPANGTVNLSAGLAIVLKGAAANLDVDILRGGASTYKSTLGLRVGTPFSTVLSSGAGKYLLILVVKQP